MFETKLIAQLLIDTKSNTDFTEVTFKNLKTYPCLEWLRSDVLAVSDSVAIERAQCFVDWLEYCLGIYFFLNNNKNNFNYILLIFH